MEQHDLDAIIQELMRFNEAQVQLNTRMVTTMERLEVTTSRLEVTNARLELTLQAMLDLVRRGNSR